MSTECREKRNESESFLDEVYDFLGIFYESSFYDEFYSKNLIN